MIRVPIHSLIILSLAMSTPIGIMAQDISQSTVTTAGSTTARTEGDRWADIINVKDFGGTTNPNSIQNAITAAYNANLQGTAGVKSVYIPAGTYTVSSTIVIKAYVSIIGDGPGVTIIKPTMTSGPAFSSDAANGGSAYRQMFRGFAIDGTNATESAYAWLFNKSHNCQIDQVRIEGFSNTTSPAVLVQGFTDSLSFTQCIWRGNASHLQVLGNDPAHQQVPTPNVFQACRFEASTSDSAVAVDVRDANAIKFTDCIFQSNKAYTTLLIENTDNALSPMTDHAVRDCWFEENGNAQPNSTAIYLKGTAAKPISGVIIEGNHFHQQNANCPNFQLRMEYTDKTYINRNSERYGGVFLKNSGNNTNVFLEGKNVSSCEIAHPITALAWGHFSGKGSVQVYRTMNVLSIVRNGVGNYTVTMEKPASGPYYPVVATTEDSSLYVSMTASVSPTTSTISFTIQTTAPNGQAADGRFTSFIVFG